MKKIILLLLGIFILSPTAMAANKYDLTDGHFPIKEVLKLPGDEQPQGYFKDENRSPIEAFISAMINYALAIMGTIGVILIIVAGFRMMTAGGESQKIDESKEMIKFAIYGLIFAFLSYVIVLFVQSLFTQ